MNKHKGFTLVELLIVIVVIGILASMMMISTSESTSTAKANTIISNLRNFSMAAMAYYTDSMDTFGKTPNTEIDMDKVKGYMHNEGKIPDEDKYMVLNHSVTEGGKTISTWWARYDASNDDVRIKEKLAGRAQSANLKGSTNIETTPTKTTAGKYPDYNKDAVVWLLIRTNKRN